MATTLNRFLKQRSVSTLNKHHQGLFSFTRYENHDSLPSKMPALRSTTRSFLDFYQVCIQRNYQFRFSEETLTIICRYCCGFAQFGNKKAIEDERTRL